MPRLPDATSLGGLPSGNSGRSVSSFDTTKIGEGQQAYGRGLQNLGRGVGNAIEGVANFVEGQTKQAHELDFARAQSQWLVNKSQIDELRDQDNDPASLGKYGEQYQKALDGASEAIGDPTLRERFRLGAADDVQRSIVGANNRARGIQRDGTLAETQQRLQDLRKAGLNATDENERGRVLAAGGQEIDGLAKAGLISQQDAFRQKEQWAHNFALGALEMMPPGERIAALTRASPNVGDERHKQAFQFFRAKGWTPEQAAGIVGNLSLESGGLRTDALNRGDGSDGSDSVGLAQWNAERANALRNFARAKGSDWRDFGTQLEFVQHELETTEASAGRSLKSASSVREAAGIFADQYERPAGSGKGAFERMAGWGTRLANAGGVAQAHGGLPPADIPGSRMTAALQPDEIDRLREQAEREVATEARRAEQQAREERSARIAENKAQINDLQVGLQDGTKGPEDIVAARKSGILTDGDDIAKMDRIAKEKAKEIADETTFQDVMSGKRNVNPFDPEDRKVVDAGVDALVKGAQKAGINMTPAQAGLIVFDKTGLLPKKSAVAMRGDLASTDVARVQGTATIASNMLARNPQAFAGVDGGSEIEKAGVQFDHLVNERGLSAEEAAKTIALRNDPVYKSKVAVRDEDVKTFRESLSKKGGDPSKIIAGAFDMNGYIPGGDPALGMNPKQKGAILSDYAEAATERFMETGDAEEAKAYALHEMKKIYGVSNGVLMKFPPERVVPPSPDQSDPYGYIYRTAARDVSAAIGKTVEPGDVFLTPVTGGVTAEAWRNKRQTPYTVWYKHEVDGQPVIDMLPGKTFAIQASDFEAEKRRVAEGHAAGFMAARAARTPVVPQVSAADAPASINRQKTTPEQAQKWADEQNAAAQRAEERNRPKSGALPGMPPLPAPSSGIDPDMIPKDEPQPTPIFETRRKAGRMTGSPVPKIPN